MVIIIAVPQEVQFVGKVQEVAHFVLIVGKYLTSIDNRISLLSKDHPRLDGPAICFTGPSKYNTFQISPPNMQRVEYLVNIGRCRETITVRIEFSGLAPDKLEWPDTTDSDGFFVDICNTAGYDWNDYGNNDCDRVYEFYGQGGPCSAEMCDASPGSSLTLDNLFTKQTFCKDFILSNASVGQVTIVVMAATTTNTESFGFTGLSLQ